MKQNPNKIQAPSLNELLDLHNESWHRSLKDTMGRSLHASEPYSPFPAPYVEQVGTKDDNKAKERPD